MALINFDGIVTNLDGTTVKELLKKDEATGYIDLTYVSAATQALSNTLKGDENFTYKDVYRLIALADRLHAGGEVKLESDEMTTIKERVTKGWPYIVSYRMQQLLEG